MTRLCIHYSAALSQTALTWGAIRALSPVPAAASHLFSLKSGLRIITVVGSCLPTFLSVCVCVSSEWWRECFESDLLSSQDRMRRVNVLDNVALQGSAGNYLPENPG